MNIIPVKKQEQVRKVVEIAKEVWAEHYTSIIGIDQVNYMLEKFQSEKAISDQIDSTYEYFLLDDFGYISIQLREEYLFLSKYYIIKKMRGKGFGREAMNFIKKNAKEKGLNSISLTVNKNNLNTLKAYKKLGFKVVREVVFDIGNGYIMDDFELKLDI